MEKQIDRMSNSAIACIVKGAEIGTKSFDNLIIFSGIGIGFLLTYWKFNYKLIDPRLIIVALTFFLLTVILAFSRNYYAGHCIFSIGWQFLLKCDLMLLKKEKDKNLDKEIKKYNKYVKMRKILSDITRFVFVLAILLTMLVFLLPLNHQSLIT